MKISVVICTQNPNRDLFHRVLTALGSQSLSPTCWETIVIDNCSNPSIESLYFEILSKLPDARIITEERKGYAYARKAGIDAARSDLILLVDDDCVLASDYLATAVRLMNQNPDLGTLGGSVSFEHDEGVSRLVKSLHDARFGKRTIEGLVKTRDVSRYQYDVFHGAAGMVVRRDALTVFLQRFNLYGRIASAYRSNIMAIGMFEDHDMSMSALHGGYAIGRSGDLKLTHVTPKSKMSVKRFLMGSYIIGFQWELFRARWNWYQPNGKVRWEYLTYLKQLTQDFGLNANYLMRQVYNFGRMRARLFLIRHPELAGEIAYRGGHQAEGLISTKPIAGFIGNA